MKWSPTMFVKIIIVLCIIVIITGIISYIFYRSDIRAAYQQLNKLDRQTVDTSKGKIEFALKNEDGYPILVVHGAAGGFDQGIDFASGILTEKYMIVAPSRFGYLGSSLPEGASPRMQADVFIDLLDKLGIYQTGVIATSAGGSSAVQLAINYPERVSALVLVSTAIAEKPLSLPPRPVVSTITGSDYIFWLLTHPLQSVTRKMFVPGSYELKPEEEAELADIVSGLLPIKPRSEGLVFDMFITNTDPYNNSSDYILEDINVPALVINARDDPAANYEDAKIMSQRIPGARLVSIEEGGHMMLGSGDVVRTEVNRFFNSIISRSGRKK